MFADRKFQWCRRPGAVISAMLNSGKTKRSAPFSRCFGSPSSDGANPWNHEPRSRMDRAKPYRRLSSEVGVSVLL